MCAGSCKSLGLDPHVIETLGNSTIYIRGTKWCCDNRRKNTTNVPHQTWPDRCWTTVGRLHVFFASRGLALKGNWALKLFRLERKPVRIILYRYQINYMSMHDIPIWYNIYYVTFIRGISEPWMSLKSFLNLVDRWLVSLSAFIKHFPPILPMCARHFSQVSVSTLMKMLDVIKRRFPRRLLPYLWFENRWPALDALCAKSFFYLTRTQKEEYARPASNTVWWTKRSPELLVVGRQTTLATYVANASRVPWSTFEFI